VVPPDLRTTGIALVGTILAIARLCSSIVFGAAWSWKGPDVTIVCFLIAAALAIAASVWLLGVKRETT
jgi:hypothetical protein